MYKLTLNILVVNSDLIIHTIKIEQNINLYQSADLILKLLYKVTH